MTEPTRGPSPDIAATSDPPPGTGPTNDDLVGYYGTSIRHYGPPTSKESESKDVWAAFHRTQVADKEPEIYLVGIFDDAVEAHEALQKYVASTETAKLANFDAANERKRSRIDADLEETEKSQPSIYMSVGGYSTVYSHREPEPNQQLSEDVCWLVKRTIGKADRPNSLNFSRF